MLQILVENAGILTQIPAYADQPVFKREHWEHIHCTSQQKFIHEHVISKMQL